MRLCKDSTNPPSHGWPGGMNAWSVSCSLAQRPTAAAMNLGRVQLSVYPSFCLKGLMHDE